jgi:hypothetical protein
MHFDRIQFNSLIEEMAQSVVDSRNRNLGHWYDGIDPKLRNKELPDKAREILEDITSELLEALKKS